MTKEEFIYKWGFSSAVAKDLDTIDENVKDNTLKDIILKSDEEKQELKSWYLANNIKLDTYSIAI